MRKTRLSNLARACTVPVGDVFQEPGISIPFPRTVSRKVTSFPAMESISLAELIKVFEGRRPSGFRQRLSNYLAPQVVFVKCQKFVVRTESLSGIKPEIEPF